MTTHVTDSAADALDGKVIFPEDGRYDEARLAWNLALDQRPAAVVFPESAQEVAAAVSFAAQRGLRVAAQGTGHGATPLGVLDDTMLVKTERMRGVQVDSARQTARVQAGTQWVEVVQAAAKHGLAGLSGSSPDVGVVGYTLGGGLSFLGRKYGLAANNVQAIELVTADGSLVRADHDHQPDLFWALRGGGGSFGVVTAIELDLFPIEEVYAGILWYPIERGHEVLHAWRELTERELPDELTTVGRFLNLPPIPDIPEPVRGKSFAVVEVIHLGDKADADHLLEPLRALGPVNDTIGPMPLPALSHLHMDPEHPVPGVGDGSCLAALPSEAVDAVVETAGAGTNSALLSVEIRQLGGELGRARPQNGAQASIEAPHALYAVGMAPAPEVELIVRTQVSELLSAMSPWTSPHRYCNFTETSHPGETLWSESSIQRLRQIKASVDPEDRIRSNHPVVA